jgi:DNA-binding GntR family transcriptional regulator
LFNILEEEFGLRLAYANEEVDATFADTRTAALLKVDAGAPLLRIRQLLYSTAAQPTVYSLGLYRSDRHSLSIRRFR